MFVFDFIKSNTIEVLNQHSALWSTLCGPNPPEGAANTLQPRPFLNLYWEIWWHHIISVRVDLNNWHCGGV